MQIDELWLQVDHTGSRHSSLVLSLESCPPSCVSFALQRLDWKPDFHVVHRRIREERSVPLQKFKEAFRLAPLEPEFLRDVGKC